MSTNTNDVQALTHLQNNIILAEITIRCRLCRLLCQMGAIHSATKCLLTVIETVQEHSPIVELDSVINTPKENIQLFIKAAMESINTESDTESNPGNGVGTLHTQLYVAGLAPMCVSAGLILYCLNEVR